MDDRKGSMSVRGTQSLDPIQEEVDRINFKEQFSTIKRPINTKIIGGGPIYPQPVKFEKNIIELDKSCQEYK